MFKAFRTVARQAASQTSNSIDAANTAAKPSIAAAVLFGIVVAADQQAGNKNETENGEDQKYFNCSSKEPQAKCIQSQSDKTKLTYETPGIFKATSQFNPKQSFSHCEHSSASTFHSHIMPDHDLRLQRAVTSRRMAAEAVRKSFFSLYEVDFDHPLGSGAYGDVYLCRELATGEECALKKIPKEFTEDEEFQREMNALLHIRAHGSHPNVCMLRENFDEDDDYLLVLDLVLGKEMFDHLIEHGAYSEADASRLLRQVASALDYIHGIGVVHADLKPENIMLRSTRGDSVIKVIDFGCSEVLSHPEEEDSGIRLQPRLLDHGEGATTAYCPPEAFDDDNKTALDPSADMWALGVIVYMMLLGRHPFDLNCDASNEEIARRIKEQRQPPLKDCPLASQVSPSALDLISKLMEPDPNKRMTAHDMLHHPWVTGETAREDVMKDSVKNLKTLLKYKTGIERTVIESLISFSDDDENENVPTISASEKRTSLLERAFDHIDKDKKGFLSEEDLNSLHSRAQIVRRLTSRNESEDKNTMSFNHFTDLIAQNMRSVHFPRGHVIYREGDDGDFMYFINSGTIEVSTNDGFKTIKGQGDHFGKGGILGRKRRTTITCKTPVNVLRVDKEMFQKHVIKGSPLALKLREKINRERFDRAVSIIDRNGNVKESLHKKGDIIFKEGEIPKEAYIVKEGLIDIKAGDHHIYSVKPRRIFGVQSHVMKRNRKASAVCQTANCVIKSISLEDLQKLADKYPELKSTLQELALRQEFRRAVVLRRMKSFPTKAQLKEAFDMIDINRSGSLDAGEIRMFVQQHLGAEFSDKEISVLINSLDLNESGEVDFSEFQSVFGSSSS